MPTYNAPLWTEKSLTAFQVSCLINYIKVMKAKHKLHQTSLICVHAKVRKLFATLKADVGWYWFTFCLLFVNIL